MILAINGSPNKKGNNEKVIDICLEVAKKKGFEVEKINLYDHKINYCTDCGYCKDNEGCSIKDDCSKVLDKLQKADGILISSPVFYGNVSGQIKVMFDRTQTLRRNGFKLKDKVGAAIAIGGSRNGGQEHSIGAIHNWMHIHGMIVVGDGSHFGGALFKPIEDDSTGIDTAKATIEKLCSTVSKVYK